MERTHLPETGAGSKDGSSASDNDQPYTFGRKPRAIAPWPFTERQYARLLLLRSRVQERLVSEDVNRREREVI